MVTKTYEVYKLFPPMKRCSCSILHSIKLFLVPTLCQMPWYIPKGIDIYLTFTGKVKSGKLQTEVETIWLIIAANIY